MKQQEEMRAHRRKLAQDLKNAKRKKQRLTKRARLLSTEDLLTVVALREGPGFDAGNVFGAAQSTGREDPDLTDGAARGSEDEQQGEVGASD